MTSKITVNADGKQAVRVTQVRISTGKPTGYWCVNEGDQREFPVEAGMALVVHYIHPDDPDPMTAKLALPVGRY